MRETEALSLTDAEHRAMILTGELYNLLAAEVVGTGPAAREDLAELGAHIHGVQNMILAQSAAREYPDRYRLLGEVVVVCEAGG
jgi:hypothetical protein